MKVKLLMMLSCISIGRYNTINDIEYNFIRHKDLTIFTQKISKDVVFDTVIEFVIRNEGHSYVYDASINEESKMGITSHTFKRYYGYIKPESIKMLTKKQAILIYKKFFWDANNLDDIVELGYMKTVTTLMDSEVNLGSYRANKMFQEILGMPLHKRNGIIDDATIMYIKSCNIDDDELYTRLIKKRKDYYTRLVTTKPVYSKYKHGWFNRLDSIVSFVKEV